MMRGLLEDASFNQSPPFAGQNLFTGDTPLTDMAERCGLDAESLSRCGADYGSEETLELGRLANENPPKLRIMDAKGFRADRVEFHPAYHELMAKSIGFGIHGSVHDGSDAVLPMTTRAARQYMATQAESWASLSRHDDPCLRRRARRRAGPAGRLDAEDHFTQL